MALARMRFRWRLTSLWVTVMPTPLLVMTLPSTRIPETPFTKAVGLPRLRAHWVRPSIVVQAGFIEWTKFGKLRHPRFLGLRSDKSVLDVVREAP